MSSTNGSGREGNRSLGQIFASITEDISSLIRGEIALAKAEVKQSAQEAAKGAGLIGAALFLATLAFIFLLVAAAYGIVAAGLPVWAGFLIVAGVLILITALLAAIAVSRFKKVKGPERAQQQREATREALKGVPQKFKDATERAGQQASSSAQANGAAVATGGHAGQFAATRHTDLRHPDRRHPDRCAGPSPGRTRPGSIDPGPAQHRNHHVRAQSTADTAYAASTTDSTYSGATAGGNGSGAAGTAAGSASPAAPGPAGVEG